jgi:hypothetical protein
VEEGEEEVEDREVEGVAEVEVSEGEEEEEVVDLIIEAEVVEEEVGEVSEEAEEDGTDSFCTFTILIRGTKSINADHNVYHPYWVLNCNS